MSADESVIIEVKDQVSSGPARKIREIAKEALSAHSAIESLKAVLASVNDSALSRIKSSLKQTTSETLKNQVANQRLEQQVLKTATAKEKLNQAQQRSAVVTKTAEAAAARSAIVQEKLSFQIQRTATATMQAEAALNRAVVSETNAAAASQRLATAKNQTAIALQRNATEIQKTAIASKQLESATSRAITADLRAKITTEQLSAAKDRATLASTRLSTAKHNLEARTKSLNLTVGSLYRTYLLLGSLIAGGLGIINYADSYTVLQNKLQIVTESQRQVNQLTGELFDLAIKTRAPIEATTQSFARFDMALKNLGASQSETLRLTETINKSLIISGATTQESASGLLQLSQAFNKGKLDGDEFRSVMELMPVVSQAIAKELKVTRGELLKLAPEGKITAEVMRAALANVADEVDSKFGRTTATVGQAFTVLQNSLKQTLGEMNNQLGVTNALSAGIITLSHNFDILAVGVGTFAAAMLLKAVPSLWAFVAGVGVAIFNAVRYQIVLARMTGMTLTAASAAGVLNAALIAVTSPLGLLITALGAAVAAMVWYKSNSEELAEIEKERTNQVNELANAYKNYSQQRFAAEAIKVQKEALAVDAELIKKRKELSSEQSKSVNNLNVLGGSTELLSTDTKKLTAEIAELEKKQTELAIKTKAVNKVFNDGLPTVNDYTDALRLPQQAGLEEERAEKIALVTTRLDNELSRMKMLASEREIQQEFDKIEERLLRNKVTLNDAEAKSIRDKIKEIKDYNEVQKASDEIFNNLNQPIKSYIAALTASKQLLDLGAISVANYTASVTNAAEQYEKAVNPLYEINKQLEIQQKLMNLPAVNREVENEVIQTQLKLLEQGINLGEQDLAILRKKIELRNENDRILQNEQRISEEIINANRTYIEQLQAIQNLKSTGQLNDGQASQAVIDANPQFDFANTDLMFEANREKYANMYSQIEEMRKRDLISEQTSSQLKMRVWQQEQQQKLQTASSFFGTLAGLQNSNSKELARIGKAAAIAQSVINTYLAATSALANIPPPLNIPAAIAITALGFQQVNAIRSQPVGFMSGGYTGNAARNAVAGVVHGQEYVFDAAATSRIGVQNLESLRNGDLAVNNFQSGSGGEKTDARQFILQLNVEAFDASGVDSVLIERKEMLWNMMVEAANERGQEL